MNDHTTHDYAGQFRLAEIQVHNWGTFDGLHRVPVARDGFLITGPSGSGKSTLIDAVSTILVPPAQVRFNAAAGASGGQRSGRNLVTYCRGAWRREHAAEVDELTQSFLRTGPVWSGVLLRYDDGAGQSATALRLMYLSADAHSPADVTNLFVLLPRTADLTEFEELARGGLNITTAKKQLPDALSVQRTHPPFVTTLRRHLGIVDPSALQLLHRTQSAKTLGDLNYLMRHFMLPEPDTFKIAATAVENFTQLQSAHQSVIAAREQVEQLRPVRDADRELTEITRQQTETEADSAGVEQYVLDKRVAFAEAERDEADGEITALTAARHSAQASLESVEAELETVRAQIHGVENAGVIHARAKVDDAEHTVRRVTAQAQRFTDLSREIDAEPPQTAEAFADFRLQVTDHCADLAEQTTTIGDRRPEMYGRMAEANQRLEQERQELQAIRTYRSSMDRRLLTAREKLAELTNLRQDDLPFVADLIHMRDGEHPWQPAAERVLGGFARTLLVPEEHYAQVAAAIDATHLGAKLQYVRFTPELAQARPGRITAETLASKITVRAGRFHDWLQSELSRRFDHLCVDTMDQFHAAQRAVTRQGQVKRDRHRHEKDDRSLIDDRRRWVLSGDVDDKIAELQRSIRGLEEQLTRSTQAKDELESAALAVSAQLTAAKRLLETEEFALIDVASAQRSLAELRRTLDELTDENTELAALKAAERQLVPAVRAQREKLDEINTELGGHQRGRRQAEALLAELGERMADAEPLSEEVRSRLAARFRRHTRKLRADNIDTWQHTVTDELGTERARLTQRASKQENIALNAMAAFLRRWEERKGDLVAEQAWRPDFIRELERLEADDLPRFEERFRDLLREQTRTHLSRLLKNIRQAASGVRSSIEAVNQSLADVEFYPGTYLKIEVRDAQPAETRQFVAKLTEVVDGVLAEESLAGSEQRFLTLKEVVGMLSVSDETSERVHRLRLDTREHVKFLGVETAADGTRGAVYDSAEGLSGGQAQKLSSFCLAAALRYQLTGAGLPAAQARASTVDVDGKVYPKFSTIILDEAFDRADSEFTRAAMDAFRQFGFHMILATPEKLLQTVQDYIGGLVMVDSPDRRHSVTSQLTIEEAARESSGWRESPGSHERRP